MTQFLTVDLIRREHGSVWAEWQTWPAEVRPRTGDWLADAILLNPAMFLPTDRVRLLNGYLQHSYEIDVAVAVDAGDEDKLCALGEARPPCEAALSSFHGHAGLWGEAMDFSDPRATDPDACLTACVWYNLARLLEQAPWVPGFVSLGDQ